MQIVIVCGGEGCGQEFKGETKDRRWECPHCGRAIDNKYYPFLSARLMQARIDRDAADWKEMFERLREEADNIYKDRAERLARLKRELEGEPWATIDTTAIKFPFEDAAAPDAGGNKEGDVREWRRRYDDLLSRARAIIVQKDDEIDSVKKKLDEKLGKGKKGG